MDNLGQTIFTAGKDWFLGSIMTWLHWCADQVLQTVGWPGVVGLAAAGLLLLSLSARAVRFLHSWQGMGVAAGVASAGMMMAWFSWPLESDAAAVPPLATGTTPAAELAKIEPVAAIQASKVEEPEELKPLRSPAKGNLAAVPILGIVDPGFADPLPVMPVLPAPHLPKPLGGVTVHTSPLHAKKPPPVIVHRSQAGGAVTGRGNQPHRPGGNGNGFGVASGNGAGFGNAHNSGHIGGQAGSHHRPTINDLNRQAAGGHDPFASAMGGFGGFGHPMHAGGMNHLAGGHLAGGHPAMAHGGHVGHR